MSIELDVLLAKTQYRKLRCPACGGRGWRLDLDERCACVGCCEEHFPSDAMTPKEQAQHVCPNCGWVANPEYLDALDGGQEGSECFALGAVQEGGEGD